MARDQRGFIRETNRRLVIGFVMLLFLVGGGLIYLIYGPEAALSGALCLFAGLAPFGLLWAILSGLEWLGERTDQW